ncbi:MAG: 5'/3'-nucleotidase SurE [Christensenellaceae bacterium]|jgi:5'-nucleotidase|nr:5'/3'-nucleotidase SurE [Christensenellaceae bacterium]
MAHILLSNDDGIHAEGIIALYEALRKKHRVTVVAPSEQRSGAGHGITTHGGLRAEKTGIGFAVNGSPADCVLLGLCEIAPDAQIVVSGMNAGANLGADTHYSGTVSAAMEGVFQRRPALAFSVYSGGKGFINSAYCGEISAEIFDSFLQNPLPPGCLLNVNLPNLEAGERPEVVVAPLGFQQYHLAFTRLAGGEFLFTSGASPEFLTEGSDGEALRSGKIVLTPLHWDMTAHAELPKAERIAKALKRA